MVVLSLADLAARGRLPPHEAVRGELVFLEDYDEARSRAGVPRRAPGDAMSRKPAVL